MNEPGDDVPGRNSTQHHANNNQYGLTRAKYVDNNSSMETFSDDSTGNWTPQGGGSTATNFTIADYSDLVVAVDSIYSIEYTPGGNMLDDKWQGIEYEWNHFNQLTAVENGMGTPLFDFEYGAGGNRLVQESHSGGTTTRAFIYDREDVVVEFSNDTFSTVFRQYIHGPGIDEPLVIQDGEENYIYYLHDGLGSVTGFVDKKDKLLGIYDYAAFGEERKNTISFENRYRYTSREFVNDELYYYRARYMRPDLGRFVSMDPLGMVDGTNQNIYTVNYPVYILDPFGENGIMCPVPIPPPLPTSPHPTPCKPTPTPTPIGGPYTPTPWPTKTPLPWEKQIYNRCFKKVFHECLYMPDGTSLCPGIGAVINFGHYFKGGRLVS